MKKQEMGGKKPNPTEQKDFLKRGHQIARQEEEIRRENLIRLVGTEKFPTWKSLSDALGYKDASRISHLKGGLKRIRPSLARGMENQLGLPSGYFDADPQTQTRTRSAAVNTQNAARRYLAKEATARDLAHEYGVTEAIIYKWVSEFRLAEDTSIRHRLIPMEVAPSSGTARATSEVEAENRRLREKLMELMLKHDEI